MKMKELWKIFLLFACLPLFGATSTCWLVKDMYVYGDPDIVNTPTARSDFFSFAKDKGIQRVYLEAYYIYNDSPTKLINLINDCEKNHIQVTLLYGDANWTLTANHKIALQRANEAVEVAAQIKASNNPAPDAVQFDVEPYLADDGSLLDLWDTDHLQGTANQYLDLLDELHNTLKGKLKFTVAIPFWFDGDSVTRNGKARPLSEWVIDATDGVVMMDYRNSRNSIESCSSSEIAYAGSQGKTVTLAVDTDPYYCTPEFLKNNNNYTSFCDQGQAAMDSALMNVWIDMGNQNGFGGFAMYDYKHWKALKP